MKYFSTSLILSLIFLTSCTNEEVPEEALTPTLPSEPTVLTGKFLDSPVEGLIYQTESREGTTNSNGEFKYEEGEEVSFFVGNIKIGKAVGKEVLTPIDIATTPNSNINTSEVKNIAAFLQTFDADKDPGNGIKISSEAVEAISLNEINFRNPIIQLLGELVFEINQSTLANLEVVFPEVAASHLAQSLQMDYELSGLEAGAFFDIIERWETRTRYVHWIHEFDSQGRISSSQAFEKYPWRPILKYTYSEYNSRGYPQFFTGDHLNQDGSTSFLLHFYLGYGQNSEVKTFAFSPSSEIDPNFQVWEIDEVDEKRRVTEYTTIDLGNPAAKTIFEYNDLDNTNKQLHYSYGNSEPKWIEELFYTEFGAVAVKKRYSANTELQTVNRYYRENYTLEKQVIINHKASEPDLKTIEFSEENGKIYRREKYIGEFLSELFVQTEENSSMNTVYDIEDGSYYIEYRSNYQIYKTEYYDPEGNLLYTEE